MDRKTFDAVRAFSELGRPKRVLVSGVVAMILGPLGVWPTGVLWAVVIAAWEYLCAPNLDTVIARLADRGAERQSDLLLRTTIAFGGLLYVSFLALLTPLQPELAAFVVVAWTAGSLIHGSMYYDTFADYHLPVLLMNSAALVGSPFVFLEEPFAAVAGAAVLMMLIFAILTFAKDRNALVRDLQEARLLAEINSDAKLRFLALVSHEIRTPLSGITGVADILSATQLDAKQDLLVRRMQSASAILSRIVDDVLLATKVREGRMSLSPAPFGLDRVIHDAAEPFMAGAKASGIDLQIDSEAVRGKWYDGDAARVQQIIANLVSNALKFTNSGRIAISASDCQGAVMIEVTDSGIGMSEQELTRIFDPFEQTPKGMKAGGTGLGLAIVRMLTEMMDGTVKVESKVGVGTSFFVRLPLAACAKPPETDSEPALDALGPHPPSQLSVLIVDDSEMNREVLRLTLQAVDVDAVIAADGEQALAITERTDFDVIFLDYRLPGIDGLELARRLRDLTTARETRPKLILSTADDLEAIEADARSAGVDAFLQKPMRPRAILSLVSDMLGHVR